MHRRRNLFILISAVVLLLFAVGLEHPYFHFSDTEWSSVVFSGSSLVSLLKELSFALFIAWLIIISIETQTRKADQETADRLRRDIATDVFKGVFSRDLPSSYVNTVISTSLQPTLLRDFVDIGYTIEAPNERDRIALGDSAENMLVLCRRLAFRLRNVSARRVEEEIKFFMAYREDAPQVTGLTKFRTGPDNRNLEDRVADLRALRVGGDIEYVWHLSLGVGESAEFVVEDRQLKEMVENEIWSSFHPTMQADITLNVKVAGLEIGLVDRTATPVVEVHRADDDTSARWEMDGPLLPHDSFTLWWQPKRKRLGSPASAAKSKGA